MPRGRHRHSPPLHRLLLPSAVAGASVLSAAAAWLLTEPVLLRSLTAVAAAAAVTGAVLMRSWDRAAGRRVADLTRGRAGDAWRSEERIAELESEAEDGRERRAKLETKLRAKRVELAKLRNEHADLLRRYAAAETGRASALEGRRQLVVETAAPSASKALSAVGAAPTPAMYLRAAKALDALVRDAAETERTLQTSGTTDGKSPGKAKKKTDKPDGGGGPGGGNDGGPGGGKAAAGAGAAEPPVTTDSPAADAGPRALPPAPAGPTVRAIGTGPVGTGPAALAPAAIVPYGPRRTPGTPVRRPEGGFDFFGTAAPGHRPPDAGERDGSPEDRAIAAAHAEDLADVVGEEALAEHEQRTGAPVAAPAQAPTLAPAPVAGEVIDLTAHDETEKLDMSGLRDALSS
ncbi:hypothetical protein [Streptomyces sp. NPDC058953]|uniref:hypothetical protein n=1 Tax=unclassified Streptomyces TaxID=2593676 RepID=UPI0036A3C1C9